MKKPAKVLLYFGFGLRNDEVLHSQAAFMEYGLAKNITA
jgi:hypothetical protein